MSQDNFISLDVGGKIFKTTREALTSINNSYFSTLAELNITKLVNIDRDYKHFNIILNYLRDKSQVILPISEHDLLQLEQEANYYCLPDLTNLINNKITSLYYSSCVFCNKKLHVERNKDRHCTENKLHTGRYIYTDQTISSHWDCCGTLDVYENTTFNTCSVTKDRKLKQLEKRHHVFT